MKSDRVAGLGFRDGASLAALLDALERAGAKTVRDLAVPATRAHHPLTTELARMGYRLRAVTQAEMAAVRTVTESAIARRTYGTGSVAEACALAVAGPGAQLAGPRAISADRMATAAIAIRKIPDEGIPE